MCFKPVHQGWRKARCTNRNPLAAVGLEKIATGRQETALAAGLEHYSNPDRIGLGGGVALHVQEALPQLG